MASFIALSWHSWQQPSAVTAGFGQRLSGCLCSTVVHLHCQSMVAPCEVGILHPLAPQNDLPSFPGRPLRKRFHICLSEWNHGTSGGVWGLSEFSNGWSGYLRMLALTSE